MNIKLEHGRGNAPLYIQLADALEQFICASAMEPGSLLPGETALATANQLSRTTVAKAFDLLIEKGRVVRKQGKGTFVSSPPMQRLLPELSSFTEHVRGLGMAPSGTLLKFERIPAGSSESPENKFGFDVDLVLLERLRSVDGKPVGLQRTIIPFDVAESIGLTEAQASSEHYSFYQALKESSIALVAGDETLRATNAEDSEARILGVEPGEALVEIVRNSYDTVGKLIEIVRARYLGSQYIYHISFAPPSLGGINNASQKENNARSTGGGFVRTSHGLLK